MSNTDHDENLTITAEDPRGEDAARLIGELCSELSARYDNAPSPFHPEDVLGARAVFLIARLGMEAVGCGALRRIDDATVEIKRMYVAPAGRRRGIARGILSELERRAAEFGYGAVRLETGDRQEEAIGLYDSAGYMRIAPYGAYVGCPFSVCYEKRISRE
jgi:putative acetyltransferase